MEGWTKTCSIVPQKLFPRYRRCDCPQYDENWEEDGKGGMRRGKSPLFKCTDAHCYINWSPVHQHAVNDDDFDGDDESKCKNIRP